MCVFRHTFCLVALSFAVAACSNTPGTEQTDCTDGTDNDGDGLIDDADPGCPWNQNVMEWPDPRECNDGVDNDGDGLIDLEDWGCPDSMGDEETDPVRACNDGVDNDADGKADFYGVDIDGDGVLDLEIDTGCENPIDDDEFNYPACQNGLDDDVDGEADYPFDAGCASMDDDDEFDDCPLGPTCPACSDTIDNDGDGFIDNADPGCGSASDTDEYHPIIGPCGPSLVIMDLSATGEAMGSIMGPLPNELTSDTCHGYGGEYAFMYNVVAGPVSLVVSTDYPETTLDTVIYVRSECRDPDRELGCDDDGGITANNSSTLVIPLVDTGSYYVIVDSYGPGSLGDFKVTVDERAPLHGPCDPLDPTACVPGLICRPLTPGDPTTCEFHECGDSIDNEGDGITDFPLEPGCSNVEDDTETDDCPAGPLCPDCGNGVDDDADGLIDYSGGDPGCDFASDSVELDECVPGVTVSYHGGGTVTGTTVGGTSLLTAPAGCDSGGSSATSPERVYVYTLNQTLTNMVVSTAGSGYDSVHYVRTPDCGVAGPLSMCTNATDINIASPAMGDYFVIVDGNWGAAGAFNLTITGTIAVGQPCIMGDTNFVCVVGSACVAGVCEPADCNNGIDDDADGFIDSPNDPGCLNISDPDETDDCPAGPMCPQCGNGIDDDADGMIDYPMDDSCTTAADDDESCLSFGVDTFGYQGCQDVLGATPPCEDISTTGSLGCSSDDCNTATALPFTFDFYGVAQTSVGFGSNGKLGFPGSTIYSNTCTIENNTIAAYWDDLYPPSGGSLRYQTFGTAPNRHITFQWNVPHISGGTFYDIRAVLYEGTNDIDVCYVDTVTLGATTDNGGSATTGIRGSAAGDVVNFSCNSAVVTSGLLLRYTHP